MKLASAGLGRGLPAVPLILGAWLCGAGPALPGEGAPKEKKAAEAEGPDAGALRQARIDLKAALNAALRAENPEQASEFAGRVGAAAVRLGQLGGKEPMKTLLDAVAKIPPSEDAVYWGLVRGIVSFGDRSALCELGDFLTSYSFKIVDHKSVLPLLTSGKLQKVAEGNGTVALAFRPAKGAVPPGQKSPARSPGVVVVVMSHFGHQGSTADEHSLQNILLNVLLDAHASQRGTAAKKAPPEEKEPPPEEKKASGN